MIKYKIDVFLVYNIIVRRETQMTITGQAEKEDSHEI